MAFVHRLLVCCAVATGAAGILLREVGKGNATAATNSSQTPDFINILVPIPMPLPIPIPFERAPTPAPPPAPTPSPPQGPIRRPWKCEDIKDRFTCRRARLMFGFDCIAFNGDYCIPAIGAKCSDIQNPVMCARAWQLGMPCIGWTGVQCIR
mmetsp:Transcript_67001/g.178442  ORF Transcript_67001/g.178442 Transcript_67001/m.178442 type:complete len:152 (-) Transcript_67001:97-552(-)